MRRMRAGAAALFLVALVVLPAEAAVVRHGERVTVGPDEVIADDLYVSGGELEVRGRVNGDLVVAGGKVRVEGPVSGDLLAAGGNVTVSGDVGGSARIAGGDLTIDSHVGRALVVGGGTVLVRGKGRVGRDVLVGAGNATLEAPVARNVVAGGGTLVLASGVGGNVQAQEGRITLDSGARVAGDLDYRANEPAIVAPGARVEGRSTFAAMRQGPRSYGWIAFGWLRALIGFSALGLLVLWFAPAFARRAASELRRAPGPSFGWGLVAAVVVPMIAFFVVALGAVVGGWWIGLFALFLLALALLVGLVCAALALGEWTFERARRPVRSGWAMLVGVLLLALVALVPIAGFIALLFATFAGLGALLFAAVHARRRSLEIREPPVTAPPAPMFRPPLPQP